MEFTDVLRKRRMVRTFTSQPVPDAVLQRLLRTAQRAPSAGHTQPVEIVVVRDPAVRRQLSAASWSRGARPDAGQAALVFCGDITREAERYGARGAAKYLYMDVAYAAMLCMLHAIDEGLAAAFIGDLHEEHVQAALALPPRITPVGIVILGYGDEAPRQRPWRALREIVHYDRYAPPYDWSARNLPPRRN
jgi:nitroreductase